MKDHLNADFIIIHFNCAHRSEHRESTEATAIHPVSQRCEEYLAYYAKEQNIKRANGVLLLEGLGTEVIEKLVDVMKFTEATFFTDTIYKVIVALQNTEIPDLLMEHT